MTDASPDRLPAPYVPTADAELQHVTVVHDDGVAVCTLFPRDRADADATTHWLAAAGDSFVALEDAR